MKLVWILCAIFHWFLHSVLIDIQVHLFGIDFQQAFSFSPLNFCDIVNAIEIFVYALHRADSKPHTQFRRTIFSCLFHTYQRKFFCRRNFFSWYHTFVSILTENWFIFFKHTHHVQYVHIRWAGSITDNHHFPYSMGVSIEWSHFMMAMFRVFKTYEQVDIIVYWKHDNGIFKLSMGTHAFTMCQRHTHWILRKQKWANNERHKSSHK